MYSKNNAIKLFAAALVVYSFIVLFVSNFWFTGDEGYYSISIYEAIRDGPNLYITFLGKPAFWKPFLMIDAYALIAGLWNGILEATVSYRMVSAIFSAVNVAFVYLISREFVDDKRALLASIIYMLNPITLIYGAKIFMETFAIAFILTGLMAVIQLCKRDNKLNGILLNAVMIVSIAGASFAKSTTIGIMAFLIYALYAFLANKRKLVDVFASAAASLLIVVAVPFLTQFPQAFFKLYAEDFFTKRFNELIWWDNAVSTASVLIYLLPVFLVGWRNINVKEWKNLFLLIWLIPLVIIAVKTPYVWYVFYFLLPISILSTKAIKMDSLDVIILLALIFAGVLAFIYINQEQQASTSELKSIEFIKKSIGKNSCVLYAGSISPMMYSYLEHYKYRYNVAITNVLLRNGSVVYMDANITQEQLNQLVDDYEDADFIDSISKREYLFPEWNRISRSILVKTENYNCTDFDYVAITDYFKKYDLKGYELVSDEKQIRIWKKITE